MHYVGSGSLSMVHGAMFLVSIWTWYLVRIFHCREPYEIPLNLSELKVEVRGCANNEHMNSFDIIQTNSHLCLNRCQAKTYWKINCEQILRKAPFYWEEMNREHWMEWAINSAPNTKYIFTVSLLPGQIDTTGDFYILRAIFVLSPLKSYAKLLRP